MYDLAGLAKELNYRIEKVKYYGDKVEDQFSIEFMVEVIDNLNWIEENIDGNLNEEYENGYDDGKEAAEVGE